MKTYILNTYHGKTAISRNDTTEYSTMKTYSGRVVTCESKILKHSDGVVITTPTGNRFIHEPFPRVTEKLLKSLHVIGLQELRV